MPRYGGTAQYAHAAVTNDMPSGMRAQLSGAATQNSLCGATGALVVCCTRSPTANSVTAAPTALTTPDPMYPVPPIFGNRVPSNSPRSSLPGLTAETYVSISICRGPNSGTGASPISILPGPVAISALTRTPPGSRAPAAVTAPGASSRCDHAGPHHGGPQGHSGTPLDALFEQRIDLS